MLRNLLKETERFGEVDPNPTRFYDKQGNLRGRTNKSFCVNPMI